MQVTLVHVWVKPGCVDDFVAATEPNHLGSIIEPGNLRFDVLQDAKDPSHFILYEAFATAGDAKLHKETAHYKAWRDAVADMMERPREGQPFVGIFPVV